MNTVSIKFRNNSINVSVDNVEKAKGLAERFNKRVDQIAANSNNASDSKLAFLAGLMLEDEIDSLKTELRKYEDNQNSHQEATIQLLSDTLNQVAAYLENLAKVIDK